jgi:hypothetical protein
MLFNMHDPSGWEVEQSRGAWCFAAVTKAARGTLLNDQTSQAEHAHNFCVRVYEDYGGGANAYSGSRGQDIDKYLRAIGQPNQARITYATMTGWVQQNLMPDPTPLLRAIWGVPDLTRLTQDVVKANDEEALTKVCRTIEGGGLALAAPNPMHWVVVYGYEIDDEYGVASQVWCWDPTNGRTYADDVDNLLRNDSITLLTT